MKTAPITPAHNPKEYVIYTPGVIFSTARTAARHGVAWFGRSLLSSRKSDLLECFDAEGNELPGVFFNKKTSRFVKYPSNAKPARIMKC